MKLDIKFNSLQNALNESGATLKFRYGLKSNKNLENLIKNFNKNGMLEQLNKKPPSFIGGLMFFNNIFVLGRYTKDSKNKGITYSVICYISLLTCSGNAVTRIRTRPYYMCILLQT